MLRRIVLWTSNVLCRIFDVSEDLGDVFREFVTILWKTSSLE